MENNSELVVEQRLKQLRKDKAALLRGDKRLEVFNSLPSAIDPTASREESLRTNNLLLAIVRELKALVTDQHRIHHNNVDELIGCLKYIKQLEAAVKNQDDEGEEWKRGD
jgi:hypothetical protein